MRSFLAILSTLLVKDSPYIIAANKKPLGDYVILLHGIGRSSKHMKNLAQYLRKKRYDVINLNYASTSYPLEVLATLVYQDISKKLTKEKPVHFIGHSMGGLVIRSILKKNRINNLGRVVQLAPPNKGSEAADFLKNNWLYKKIYGPAGQQLTTTRNLRKKLGKINYELGIIAGNRAIDPIFWAIIPGKNDGKVSIKSTKVTGMKDHIVLATSHTFFPKNKEVHCQTEHFIKHSVFKKQDKYYARSNTSF